MQRYVGDLEALYAHESIAADVVRPTDFFSSRLQSPGPRKFLAYVESFVIFQIRLWLLWRRYSYLHISDHSNAIWLNFLPARASVVSCHDLIALRASLGEIAEHHPRLTGRLYQALVRAGLKRARLILCVSACTESDVRRLVPGVQARVVPNVGSRGVPAGTSGSTPEVPGFALIVSNSGWRKRRAHAIDAWRRAVRSGGMDVDLVVVGPGLSDSEASACEDLKHRVQVRTNVDAVELQLLYRTAYVLIQLSQYEGFGLPIVEANENGCPAICSDLPIFREVGGEANILVPDDLEKVDWNGVDRAVVERRNTRAVFANAQRYAVATVAPQLSLAIQAAGEGEK